MFQVNLGAVSNLAPQLGKSQRTFGTSDDFSRDFSGDIDCIIPGTSQSPHSEGEGENETGVQRSNETSLETPSVAGILSSIVLPFLFVISR